MGLEVRGDSASCRGMFHRKSSGWLQGLVESGAINFGQAPRDQKPADAHTCRWTALAAMQFAGMHGS